tara:strand:- start:2072 stop:2512 length:441 start_codon:yes stop_codon:yes gene_type:complete
VKKDKSQPFVLYVAEKIYSHIYELKKKDPQISNIDAIERFMGTSLYEEISTGKFHDQWFSELRKDKFIDKKSGKKIPNETIRLLNIQKDTMMKQLIKFPNLYYAKSHFPLEISQRAFDHLWRICESYELWCRETKQEDLIYLKMLD